MKWEELTTAQVCDGLGQFSIEQLIAIPPTFVLMTFLQKTRIATEKREADIGTWVANGVFTYFGALMGARLTVNLLCPQKHEPLQIKPHKILVIVGIVTGIGAAFGFNLGW